MLAGTAARQPGVIARPITWDATLVEHHTVAGQHDLRHDPAAARARLRTPARPIRVALAASVVWSLGVWWFGEGLGGVLNGTANPVNGAPGAVILYALLAVLLWPADRAGSAMLRRRRSPPPGRSARGPPGVLWLVLWLSLAWFALHVGEPGPAGAARYARRPWRTASRAGWPGSRTARGRGRRQPRPRGVDRAGGGLRARSPPGSGCPGQAARATLVLALVAAAAIWVVGEAFGMILAGGATDPNSGPLLALLALAYWPCEAEAAPAGERSVNAC